jgi:putative glutamine amidotransferase
LPDIAGLNDAHSQKTNSQSPMHSIKIDQDSRLARILGKTEITVNSYHHQAVNKLGYKLLETGHSDDKIVEVIEMKQEGFFLAVQWHPERLNDKESALIFKEFVKSCNYG